MELLNKLKITYLVVTLMLVSFDSSSIQLESSGLQPYTPSQDNMNNISDSSSWIHMNSSDSTSTDQDKIGLNLANQNITYEMVILNFFKEREFRRIFKKHYVDFKLALAEFEKAEEILQNYQESKQASEFVNTDRVFSYKRRKILNKFFDQKKLISSKYWDLNNKETNPEITDRNRLEKYIVESQRDLQQSLQDYKDSMQAALDEYKNVIDAAYNTKED